jgi:hypothetical protein
MQRTSANPSVASVSATGLVEGKQSGTANITLTIRDLWGNTTTATATIHVENKIPVSCDIAYNPGTNTNGNVVATLTNCNKAITVTDGYRSSGSGTITRNTGSINANFSTNGSFTFLFEDSYGNSGSAVATVNWIDASDIQPTISYNPTSPTSGNVLASISFNKTGVTITNSAFSPCANGASEVGSGTCTFSSNGSFIFNYADDYGNTGSAVASVNWIDNSAPVLTLNYSPATLTNQNVLVTLTTSKPVYIPLGWSGASVGNSFTKLYTGNMVEVVTVYDPLGHQGQTWVTIDWIDKVAPTCDVAYSPNSTTNQDVVASLVNCSKLLAAGSTISHTFVANGSHNFVFQDWAGNTGTATANVNWIDKTSPTCSVQYTPNGDNSVVLATLTGCNTTVIVTNNGGSFDYHFTSNGSFTFIYQDTLGNSGSTQATVSSISTGSSG